MQIKCVNDVTYSQNYVTVTGIERLIFVNVVIYLQPYIF